MTDSPGPYEPFPAGGADTPSSSSPTAATAPPNSINVAFWCFLVATVISVVSGVLALTAKSTVADQLRKNNTSGLTEDQINTAAQAAVIVAAVIAVVIGLIFLWLSFKLRAGRNWARITLTVLTVLQVVSLVAGQGASILGYVSVLAAVVGLVFAYLGSSNEYINAVKQSRSR
ncbi:uncharacterized protein (DUF983 family) [Amycolatopsis bartoniae]|uniref:Uncharacterized protein n=1 Tax=Amycolatopsis bartoniae TaxID=941986 RepID=A0A8H9IRN2_9PSEU|nr:hypothetical protein [Amycolatopsis bartoniae]MBB2938167.1 uncharacterized protein (DUF983 family) [Amycolatopsis bartoniae]TVT03228.1 hypothetical protein FNH07_25895 [Amycolatopsis bartoniae]GHF33136.1 hypothetical protein GCM10017566_02200 [Amycolatopsis bartoniae]